VVLFLGVFYHMIDPIVVLQQVASLAKDLPVIETHQDLLALDRPAMAFYPGTTRANDPSNWWGPNPECVTQLLASTGFCHLFYQRHPVVAERGIYHAFRSAETARRYMRRPSDSAMIFDLGSEAGRRAIYGGTGVEFSTRIAAEHDAALAEIPAMRRSTSWRLTAPLRGMKRLTARALRGGGRWMVRAAPPSPRRGRVWTSPAVRERFTEPSPHRHPGRQALPLALADQRERGPVEWVGQARRQRFPRAIQHPEFGGAQRPGQAAVAARGEPAQCVGYQERR
jgi:hypothetical protein